MSAGIDYGMGKANIDTQTGFRHGVITANAVNPDALEDIYSPYEDMKFAKWCEGRRNEIEAAIEDALSDYLTDSAVKRIVTDAITAAEEEFDEAYCGCDSDGGGYRYEDDEYTIETTSLGLYVLRSPYVAKVKYCSPCCPGAGNLDSSDADGVEAYALGPEWFDEHSPCPYASTLRRIDGTAVKVSE